MDGHKNVEYTSSVWKTVFGIFNFWVTEFYEKHTYIMFDQM